MELLTLVAIFHSIVALLLVVLVLLQDPKGGGAAGMFGGGGSQSSFFGATGAGNFLTTLTKWMAVIFAVSSVGMTYLTSHKGTSVMDDYVPPAAVETAPAQESAPAAPKENPETKTDSDKTTEE
jgi:preprotein translocase subunit SecG